MAKTLIGPGGRLYADPAPGPDEIKFMEYNNSAAYYNSPYYLAHKSEVQPIPPRFDTNARRSTMIGPDWPGATSSR